MKTYTVAVDLGKRTDWGAQLFWKAKEQITVHTPFGDRLVWAFLVNHIELFRDITYQQQVDRLAKLMALPEIHESNDLLVDGQNVGEAVIEMMRQKGLVPIPIITTGGQTAREVAVPAGRLFAPPGTTLRPIQPAGEFHVPKNDLVDAAAVLSRDRRITIAVGTPWGDVLQKQMEAFRGVSAPRGAKKEPDDLAIHDDLVWTVMACAWWCTRGGQDEIALVGASAVAGGQLPDWNPLDHI